MTDERDAIRQRAHDARRHAIRTPAEGDALARAIERGTERITSARVIATALNDGAEAQREIRRMTTKGAPLPTFASIGQAFDKLQFSLETRARRILNRIEITEARGAAVEGKALAHADATDAKLDEYGRYFDAAETAIGNGGPLDSSSSE